MSVKKVIFSILILMLIIFFRGSWTLSQKLDHDFELQNQQEIPKPTYEVAVIVTNVDVVVTDKAGKQVTGLKPENFEIYEDDLLQRLTNFYEVKGMEVFGSSAGQERQKPLPPPEALPSRPSQVRNKIIFYFDNWHLHPLNRNWSIKKLEPFLKNNFPENNSQNLGMVVCLDQKLEILQEFTSSQWELLRAINNVKGRTGQSLLRQKNKEELRNELNRMVTEATDLDKYENYERAMGFARNYVEADQNDLLYSLKSLSAFTDYLMGIEGKKILIYVSDGLPINPSEEVFSFLDQAFPTSRAQSEAMNYDATQFFKELTAKSNANEIAIYPINAKGLESLTLSADKERGYNIYSRGSGMVKPGSRATDEALKLMASDTGGLAILNTNDIETGLEKIENDLQFYYSLGYVSPHGEDNAYHSMEVKIVGVKEEYQVRVRHGYLRISQEEKIKESVFSRLFLGRKYNPMEIMAQFMPPEKIPGSETLRLIIKLLIPIKRIALIQQKEEYFGQIKVYIALMDRDGLISPCYELSQEIKVPKKDYDLALKSYYPYLAEMGVNPGQYTVSIALEDVQGETINYLQFEREVRLD